MPQKYPPRVMTIILVFVIDQFVSLLLDLNTTDSLLLFIVMMVAVVFMAQ